MPVTTSYPGVYLEETQLTSPSVTAATTSDTAFIGYFLKGPVNEAVKVTSLNQFNSMFGGLSESSECSYAVNQFFLNGGTTAWIVRIAPGFTPPPGKGDGEKQGEQAAPQGQGTEGGAGAHGAGKGKSTTKPAVSATATVAIGGSKKEGAEEAAAKPKSASFDFSANSPGAWGNQLAVQVTPSGKLWNVAVAQASGTRSSVTETSGKYTTSKQTIWSTLETFYNVSLDPTDPQYIVTVINQSSEYVTVSATQSAGHDASTWLQLQSGVDGTWGTGTDAATALTNALVYQLSTTPALDDIAPNHFNIMCLPEAALLPNNNQVAVYTPALEYCKNNQAFLIIDPPPPETYEKTPGVPSYGTNWVDSVSKMVTWSAGWRNSDNYSGATYYPWLLVPDPLNNYNPRLVGPSGTLAGIYASTDLNRGVWKAPAGVDAVLQGTISLADTLDDADSGTLNPLGINALRTLPIYGPVVWGARTLAGADEINTVFRYVDARRLTDFIEQSLVQSLKWAVFEPNAPPLWASITLEVSAFMAQLFSEGAFQGTTAAQAYRVQCDGNTTTQTDIENGVVNVIVAFAPVPPAEFVVLQIQVSAAQLGST